MKTYLTRERAIIDMMAKYGEKLSCETNKSLEKEYRKVKRLMAHDEVVISDNQKLSNEAFNLKR